MAAVEPHSQWAMPDSSTGGQTGEFSRSVAACVETRVRLPWFACWEGRGSFARPLMCFLQTRGAFHEW